MIEWKQIPLLDGFIAELTDGLKLKVTVDVERVFTVDSPTNKPYRVNVVGRLWQFGWHNGYSQTWSMVEHVNGLQNVSEDALEIPSMKSDVYDCLKRCAEFLFDSRQPEAKQPEVKRDDD